MQFSNPKVRRSKVKVTLHQNLITSIGDHNTYSYQVTSITDR